MTDKEEEDTLNQVFIEDKDGEDEDNNAPF